MPRHRSWSYDEQRAMDKYYEWLYSECRCEENGYDLDGDIALGAPRCALCEQDFEQRQEAWQAQQEQLRREAACPNRQWREQIAFIGEQLKAIERGPSLYERLTHVRILFTEIQNERYQAFIAAQPKFRAALIKKTAELKADPQAEALVELFGHTERMIERLAERPEFKA
jgi:hypothetical protein